MKKLLMFSILSLIIAPLAVSAATFDGESSYSLPKSQTLSENAYVGGGDVLLMGNSAADLVAGGGNITAAGSVGRDALIAGGNINILGDVRGNLRSVGGTIALNSKVGGEMLLAGGQISVMPGAQVAGDADIFGGNITVSGDLKKNLHIEGGAVMLSGHVSGDVRVRATGKITVTKDAVIDGNLDYSAPQEATVESGAKIIGKVTYANLQPKAMNLPGKKVLFGFLAAAWLLKVLVTMFGTLVLVWLFKRQMQEVVDDAMSNFGKELLRGFIIMVVLPVAIIISFVTVLGVFLGAMSLVLYILAAMLSSLIATLVLGAWAGKYILRRASIVDWKAAVIGAVLFTTINFIPIVGWILCLAFFLVAFGALFNFAYRHVRGVEE